MGIWVIKWNDCYRHAPVVQKLSEHNTKYGKFFSENPFLFSNTYYNNFTWYKSTKGFGSLHAMIAIDPCVVDHIRL
jgi:hypothetical protein